MTWDNSCFLKSFYIYYLCLPSWYIHSVNTVIQSSKTDFARTPCMYIIHWHRQQYSGDLLLSYHWEVICLATGPALVFSFPSLHLSPSTMLWAMSNTRNVSCYLLWCLILVNVIRFLLYHLLTVAWYFSLLLICILYF